MTETIITEDGEVKISQVQPTPEPIKTQLAHALRQIINQIDMAESSQNDNQSKLDRICSQLTDEQWAVLADTQVRIIAVRSDDAQEYLVRTGK